jgi:hypothetical protein
MLSPFGVVVGLTAALVLGIAVNLNPYLRGPDSWRWAYALPGYPWRHLVPALVIAIYVGLMVWLLHRYAESEGAGPAHLVVLGVAVLGAPLIQAALLFPDAPDILIPLFYRTISPGASGLFTVGSQIRDPVAFLRAYPELMSTFPVHPQRYPPGLALLFYGARRGFEQFPGLADAVGWALRRYRCHDLALMALPNAILATAALQMALPAISAFIALPLYHLARTVANRRTALWAVALYPLVPSFALWSARWDQVYPLFTALAWSLFVRGLYRRRSLWFVGAGLVLSAATFLSFGLVVMLMPLGLTGLVYLLTHRDRWRFLLMAGSLFTAALILPWLAYQLLVGNGFIDIWRVAMGYHLGLDRDYWIWLGYHLYDFGLFLGVPVAMLMVVGSWRALRTAGAHLAALCRARSAPLARDATFAAAFGVSLLILNFSGAARGEVARVWLFLTPFAVVIAARVLVGWRPAWRRAVLSLLALQLLIFNAFLRVVTTGMGAPPQPVRLDELPSDLQRVEAVFVGRHGEEIALRGYTVTPESPDEGETLTVTLYWEPLDRIATSYTVFNHLRAVGVPDAVLAQQDSLPQARQAPTTCWLPGEIVPDSHRLALPAQIPPGDYELITGLYRYENGERLPAHWLGALTERAVRLTELTLPRTNR